MQNFLTGLMLAAIGLLPLVFGGVRPLSWSLYGLVVGGLLGIWALQGVFRPAAPDPRGFRIVIGFLWSGFLGLAGWFWLQGSASTPAGFHHPIWDMARGYFVQSGQVGVVQAGAISVAPERTWEALARWLAYGATFALVAGLARNRETAWTLVKGLALIGLAYAIYGLVVQLGGYNMILWFDKVAYRDVLTSTFVNRNSYATYGGLTALCWIAWLLKALPTVSPVLPARERALRYAQALTGPLILLWAGLAIVLTSVLLTQSRAGITATLLGLLVLLGGYLLAKGLTWRRGLTLVPALLLVGFVGAFSADGVIDRLQGQGTEDRMRDAAAAIMVGAVADSPWLGFGRGAFEPAFDLYRDHTVLIRFDRGHHDILETIFEIGLPAAGVLFAMLALIGGMCLYGLKTRNRDIELPALGLGALVLGAFHAAFDFSLQMPGVAALFAAIAALALAQSVSRRTRS